MLKYIWRGVDGLRHYQEVKPIITRHITVRRLGITKFVKVNVRHKSRKIEVRYE